LKISKAFLLLLSLQQVVDGSTLDALK
jgi:hypothetical protein